MEMLRVDPLPAQTAFIPGGKVQETSREETRASRGEQGGKALLARVSPALY